MEDEIKRLKARRRRLLAGARRHMANVNGGVKTVAAGGPFCLFS